MKVGEARSIYSAQLKAYNQQKAALADQKKELENKIKKTENGAVIYADEAVKLDLTYHAVADKQEEYQNYMNQLTEQWAVKMNEISLKQNAEAEKEGFNELAKVMTVARRMIHGDIVPSSDERKLMEFDNKLYQMAKNAQMMAQVRERKKYKSLWDDQETKPEQEDAVQAADNQEAFAEGPEVVSVEDTMASAAESFVSE